MSAPALGALGADPDCGIPVKKSTGTFEVCWDIWALGLRFMEVWGVQRALVRRNGGVGTLM